MNTYSLLEKLLIWARSQTNRMVVRPESISLSPQVDGVLKEFSSRAEKKTLRLENLISGDLSTYADKAAVEGRGSLSGIRGWVSPKTGSTDFSESTRSGP